MKAHIFVILTIALTVFGQCTVKQGTRQLGAPPDSITQDVRYVISAYMNLWVLAGLFAALLASACWVIALSRLPLNRAYPFMGFSFVVVAVLSSRLFAEPLSLRQLLGALLVAAGVAFSGLAR